MTIGSAPYATLLQGYQDSFEGLINELNPSGGTQKYGGGLVVSGSSLLVDGYDSYASGQDYSHFVRSTTLSTTTMDGPYKMDGFTPRVCTGPMAEIPAAWQARLGGYTHLVGEGSLSIITSSSYGPALCAFNAADFVAGTSPAPSAAIVRYTQAHPTLGAYTQSNPTQQNYDYWIPTDAIRGIVFPEGYDTVFVFGRHSTENYCYGLGGDYYVGNPNPALNYAPNTIVQPGDADAAGGTNVGDMRCYDPVSTPKGEHGYPYKAWVWAYKATELEEIVNGTRDYWDIIPYQSAEMPNVYFSPTGNALIAGATYDPATKRIFMMTRETSNSYPAIQVWTHP
jgi:hypothetical protein